VKDEDLSFIDRVAVDLRQLATFRAVAGAGNLRPRRRAPGHRDFDGHPPRPAARGGTPGSCRLWVRSRLFAGAEGFHDLTGDSTAIADRITMLAGPFPHRRRVHGTAAAAPSLYRRRFAGGLRRSTTTPPQPPTRSGQTIEVGLAQIELVAGRAVVHSNRRHGLGAVTVKIAGKHDPCCFGHNSSLPRHTPNQPLARNPKQQRSTHIAAKRSTNEPRFGCHRGCARRPGS
jgi:hypothetical protein